MSRFAGLPAALKATKDPKGKPEDNDDSDTPETDDEDGKTPPKSTTKEPDMADNDQNAAVEAAKKEADAAGFKRASDRFNAVMASEHYAGREAVATKLLSKDAMSADDIIDVLAASPKAEPAAASDEDLKKAREEGEAKGMKDALAGGKNSQVEANDEGGKPDAKAKADSVWDRAYASVDALRQK